MLRHPIFFFALVLTVAGSFMLITRGVVAQGNATPTIDTVVTALTSLGSDESNITPNENSTVRVYVHGTASDADSCEQIDTASNWFIRVYRSNISGGPDANPDNNDKYNVSSGSITLSECTGPEDTTLIYEGYIDLQYYADATDIGSAYEATDWTAYVKVTDEGSPPATSASLTDIFEVASLLAFNITASIAHATIPLGTDGAQQTITFTNTGNRALDADQTADGDMICSGAGSDNIPVGNVHLSLINGFSYGADDQALTATATHFDLSLAARIDDTATSTKDAYVILRMPASGIGGVCTNTLTFTAKANV